MVSANFNIEMVAKLTQEERKDQLQFKLTDFDRKPIAIGVLENARCGRECILYRRDIVIEVIYHFHIARDYHKNSSYFCTFQYECRICSPNTIYICTTFQIKLYGKQEAQWHYIVDEAINFYF